VRWLASILGVLGGLGVFQLGLLLWYGLADFVGDPPDVAIMELRRVAWLLMASATASVALNVASLITPLPRAAASTCIGVGLA
jgi:hypothetical protein